MRSAFFCAALACVLGCSGATAAIGDEGEGGADGSTRDASSDGATPDGGPGGACASEMPTQGAPCTTLGLSCEYGGTGPELLCSTLVSCQGAPGRVAWSVSTPSKDCIASPAQNPPACPATFSALPNGAACPSADAYECVYTQGMCGCTSCMGDGGGSQEWKCETYPTPQGCPAPRPRVGSPCGAEGQSCSYGSVCGVLGGVPRLVCKDGRWQIQPNAALCALPVCGR